MPLQVWRIYRVRYQREGWSGEGARRVGGRWNSPGVAVVYCATSLALAAVETFVHIDPRLNPEDLVSSSAAVDDDLPIDRLDPVALPPGWNAAREVNLRGFGNAWARSGRSLGLLVPSAAILGEWNLLLNPAHAGFARVIPDPPQPFRFDLRMYAHSAAA